MMLKNNKRLQDSWKDYKSKNNTDREEYNNASIIINQEENALAILLK